MKLIPEDYVMARSRLAVRILVTALGVICIDPLWAQAPLQPDKDLAAIEKIQRLLDEVIVETEDLPKEMPLAKLLAVLEKKLPKEKRLTFQIDKEAFGNKAAEVTATPVVLALPRKVPLRTIVESALAKIKIKCDYRIGPGEIAITTPQRSLYTVSYDLRDILAKPETLDFTDHGWKELKANTPFRREEPAGRASRLLQKLVSSTNLMANAGDNEAVEVLNGTRMLIRANAAKHNMIADELAAFRRLADAAIVLNTRLLEVDAASYKKVAAVKRIYGRDCEQEERRFTEGKAAKPDPLWEELEKQKPLLQGQEVKLDSGQEALVLSWQKAGTCLPAPAETRKPDDPRQSFLEGVSFAAAMRISPDRRYVRLTLTEKAVELRGLSKVQAVLAKGELDSEVPVLDETVHLQALEIPDGGTLHVPVHYRSAWAKAKNRWWVLSITPRIYIEEEERMIRARFFKQKGHK
jgi:hypothetical protein